MRLFLAIDLDEDLRNEARRAIGELRKRLGAGEGRVRANWVAPERLHLTLHFLGEDVDDATAACLVDGLREPMSEPPFRMALEGAGVFPPQGRPRVVWLGVSEGGAALARVHAELSQRIRACGLPVDVRGFTPHLTIARVKHGFGPRDVRRMIEPPLGRIGACAVDRVTLYQSRLSAAGPHYTALAASSLQAPGD